MLKTMDSKYTIPNLPTTSQVLEDLSASEVIQLKQKLKFSVEENSLQNAYECYKNFRQLEQDLVKQTELSVNLDELNKKLVDNIDSMKAQV